MNDLKNLGLKAVVFGIFVVMAGPAGATGSAGSAGSAASAKAAGAAHTSTLQTKAKEAINLLDAQECAGGPGQDCDSGTVNCTSGRALDCNSTVGNSYRSLCCQHTGSVGWVSCATYDGYGNVTSSASDSCP